MRIVFSLYVALFLRGVSLLPDERCTNYFRAYLMKYMTFISIGKRTMIGSRFIMVGAAVRNLVIGERVYVGLSCRVDCRDSKVKIGDRVLIGPGVCFETGSHVNKLNTRGLRERTTADIVVEDEVWIGANVTLLQGVRVGRGSIVAAGAVVNKDVPPNTIVGGVPIKKIRDI